MKQGLIQGQMQQEQVQPAGSQDSPAGQGGADLSQQEEGSPSKQQLSLEAAAKKILYDDKANAQVLESIKAGAQNDPYRAVAKAAFVLMADLDERAGGKIPPEDLIPAALTMMEDIALMANMAGVVELPGVTMSEANEATGEKGGLPVIEEQTLGKLTQHLVAIAIENGIIEAEDIEGLSSEMSEEELQGVVSQQEQIAGGAPQGDPQGAGQQSMPPSQPAMPPGQPVAGVPGQGV